VGRSNTAAAIAVISILCLPRPVRPAPTHLTTFLGAEGERPIDPWRRERYIVRFVTPPAAAAPTNALAPAVAAALRAARHTALSERVDEGLAAIASSLGPDHPPPTVHRRFSQALCGASLELSAAEADRVRRLSLVAAVEPDREVKADLIDSVPLVHAPEAWTAAGTAGDGVTVAVIDTGIDYSHPDLGGGLGPGHKVVGGYDFVSEDADPMDDHGHGTHVASTVAGSGALAGVAPGAKLLAYKVLDAAGSGYSSNVIAGVERALDPDGDPATDDGARVITLSLGAAGGRPDDAMSMALDAAVDAGAVVTVAAGNAGNYKSITSPGSSLKALTLGASSKSDELAWFSSRGYLPGYALKPDLVAPGLGICAAWPVAKPLSSSCFAQNHARLSGTSMATPHAAGAAAVIRAARPGLSPAEVKALLAESAVAVAGDPLSVGAGRLDVARALASPGLVLPTQLVFPPVDFCAPDYTAKLTLTLENLGPAAMLSVTTEASGPAVPLVATAPARLEGGAHTTLAFAIEAPTTALVSFAKPPYGYSGWVIVSLGESQLRVPYFVPAVSRITVALDPGVARLSVHDGAKTIESLVPTTATADFDLAVGTYDFVALYHRADGSIDAVAAGQDVVVGTCNPVLTLTRASATLAASSEFKAPDGQALLDSNLLGQCVLRHERGWSVALWGAPPTAFSPLSPRYTLEWAYQTDLDSGEVALLSGLSQGLAGPLVMRAGPGDYTSFTASYASQSPADAPYLLTYETRVDHSTAGDTLSRTLALPSSSTSPLVRPYKRGYQFVAAAPGASLGKLELAAASNPWDASHSSIFMSPVVTAGAGGLLTGTLWGAESEPVLSWPSSANHPLLLDLAPPAWFGKFTVGGTTARISAARGYLTALFLSQTGARPLGSALGYEVTDVQGTRSGSLVNAGLKDSTLPEDIAIAGSGPATLSVYGPAYEVDGIPGRAMVTASFDASRLESDPPRLNGAWLFDDGVPSDRIRGCRGASPDNLIAFDVDDASEVAGLSLSLLAPSGTVVSLGVYHNGGTRWSAVVPDLAEAGSYGIEATAFDTLGNSTAISLEPAFVYELATAAAPEAQVRAIRDAQGAVRLSWAGVPTAVMLRSGRPDLALASALVGTPGQATDANSVGTVYYALSDPAASCAP